MEAGENPTKAFEVVRPEPTDHPSTTERVRDLHWDEQAAVRATAHGELPQELVQTGVARIQGVSAAAAMVLGVYLIALLLIVPRDHGHWISTWTPALGWHALGFVMSLLLTGFARIKSIRPQVVIDTGYTYLVVLCLVLALVRHSSPWSPEELIRQVAPSSIAMLAFAVLIPAPPGKVAWVLMLAALTDPFGMYLMRHHILPMPVDQALWVLSSPAMAAVVGYGMSRVMYRLTEGIVKAREVGSYELVERLGVGGMAEVWRADHRMLARPAAVKLIRPRVLQGHGPVEAERLLRIFTREARATAKLSSPNTIQLYDFGVTREGAFYTVMELLSGVDLQTLVERFGPQPPERVVFLLRQACHSLAEAHARNFVHRDVKPANIFICRLGGEHDFVKVLDFGLVLDRHPTAEELEDEERFVGTPSVMAPEMVRFQAPVDARADLYALGCVAYWLLTAKRVFDADTRHDMLIMHAHQKPVLPSKRADISVPHELEQIVMSCLEKNPNKRPQTAHELASLLEAVPFPRRWNEERAEQWWRKNLPAEPEPALSSSPQATVNST